jgi:hypothetical protein
LLLFAVFYSLIASNAAVHRVDPEDATVAVPCWAAGLACLIAGVLWLQGRRPSRQTLLPWLKKNARELLVGLAIFAFPLGPRLVLWSEHPYPPYEDEAAVRMDAKQVLGNKDPHLFNAGRSGNPFAAFIPTGIMQLFMGHSILAVRTTRKEALYYAYIVGVP